MCAPQVSAQDGPATSPENETEQVSDRIVDGRPVLYSFKRAINPLTWLEAGVRPIVRSADSGMIHKLVMKRPGTDKTAGVKLGIDGLGAGSGFGPKVTLFHKHLLGRDIEVEVPLLFTYKAAESYQVNAKVPLISEGRVKDLSFDVSSGYTSIRTGTFFGIGNDSSVVDRSRFRTVRREVTAGFSAVLDDVWKAGFHAGYRNVGVTQPLSGPSTQDVFQNAGVAGLFTGAQWGSAVFSFERDTRDNEHVPAKGGRESFELGLNQGGGKGDFSYWKYRLNFQQYFALSEDRRKLVLVRGMAETNQEKPGSQVPFFDMPSLGDWDTLRGFDSYRFRDKSALSLGVEYRYRIWQALDWGLFLDQGQVAPEPGDFGLRRFHTGYGVRLIMLPKRDRPLSFDIGHSNEGWRLYFNIGRIF